MFALIHVYLIYAFNKWWVFIYDNGTLWLELQLRTNRLWSPEADWHVYSLDTSNMRNHIYHWIHYVGIRNIRKKTTIGSWNYYRKYELRSIVINSRKVYNCRRQQVERHNTIWFVFMYKPLVLGTIFSISQYSHTPAKCEYIGHIVLHIHNHSSYIARPMTNLILKTIVVE